MMRIAIPLYDRFTALDAVGPYEVLSRLPGATVHFVADEPGMKRTETGMLGLSADLKSAHGYRAHEDLTSTAAKSALKPPARRPGMIDGLGRFVLL